MYKNGRQNYFFEASTGCQEPGLLRKNHRTIKRMGARSGGESLLETDLIDPDPIFYDRLRHCMVKRFYVDTYFQSCFVGD